MEIFCSRATTQLLHCGDQLEPEKYSILLRETYNKICYISQFLFVENHGILPAIINTDLTNNLFFERVLPNRLIATYLVDFATLIGRAYPRRSRAKRQPFLEKHYVANSLSQPVPSSLYSICRGISSLRAEKFAMSFLLFTTGL